MKKILLAFTAFLIFTTSFAQKKSDKKMADAPKLSCVVNFNAYCTSNLEPYIEFQFLVNGKTAKYVRNEKGRYNAQIEIQVDVNDRTADTLVERLHYILLSDEFEDSVATEKPFFSDLQNVRIANGDYMLYFTIIDRNKQDTIRYIDLLTADFPTDKVSISNISLWRHLDASGEDGIFEKYGFAATPLFNQYAPESVYTLPITVEIYNTEKMLGRDREFIVQSYVAPVEQYRTAKPENIFYKNMRTAPRNLFLTQFNLFSLPSGNYNAVVVVMDPDSTVLASASSFFQRNNPAVKLDLKHYDDVVITNTFVEKITDLKTLQDYVACLYPIGSRMEQEFFLQRMKKVPMEQLQKYFYSFWAKRNEQDPESAWKEYKAKVDFVQKRYGSKVIQGYRTDRGRVYLKYGPPTHITEEPYDPQAYPYEIWHYYTIGDQTNIKFIFYNRDLISNNYELLHSDLIGEINDPAWQMKLVKRLSPNSNPDILEPEEYWGGSAREQYKYNK